MFRSLRRRLVLINVTVTTIVLLIAFLSIFIVVRYSTEKRPLPPKGPEFSKHDSDIIMEQVRDERQASLETLAYSLIAVGLLVEVAVVVISWILADIAIQPIKENYENQKVFIANASHEIKTPLAAATANLEAADLADNHWIHNAMNELETLSSLNRQLLDLTRLEDNTTKQIQTSNVVVDALIKEVINPLQPQLQQKNLEIKTTVRPKTAKITVAVDDLKQLLRIILDNAIKYSDHRIEIEYQNDEFTVKNDGEMISNEQLPHVFERFYQGDKSTEGSGLGLAIAKALVDKNHWQIAIDSGNCLTTVRVRLK